MRKASGGERALWILTPEDEAHSGGWEGLGEDGLEPPFLLATTEMEILSSLQDIFDNRGIKTLE
jgi:hypothetical protein